MFTCEAYMHSSLYIYMLHTKPEMHESGFRAGPVWGDAQNRFWAGFLGDFCTVRESRFRARMAAENQKAAFEKKMKEIEVKLKYTQGFSREALEETITGLVDWEELTPAGRAARAHCNKSLYKRSKKFCVLRVAAPDDSEELLLVEREKNGSRPTDLTKLKRVVAKEDWFDTIKDAHEALGHGIGKGRALEARVNELYARVPRWALEVCAHPPPPHHTVFSSHTLPSFVVCDRHSWTAALYASKHFPVRSTRQVISPLSPRASAPEGRCGMCCMCRT